MKRTEIKRNKPINKVSDKRKKENPDYIYLVNRLRALCYNYSELSGERPDWQFGYLVEPHHIKGRTGKLFLNPFNLIMLTRDEHNNSDIIKDKDKLLELIRPRRIKQGFKGEQ